MMETLRVIIAGVILSIPMFLAPLEQPEEKPQQDYDVYSQN